MIDLEAVELARVWTTGGTQVVSLRVGVPDPAAWGYTLADLAHHVATAYQRKGLDPRATLAAIRDAFLDELSDITSSRAATNLIPLDEATADVAPAAPPDAPTGRVERPPARVEHVTSGNGVIDARAPTPRNKTPKPRRPNSRASTKPR